MEVDEAPAATVLVDVNMVSGSRLRLVPRFSYRGRGYGIT